MQKRKGFFSCLKIPFFDYAQSWRILRNFHTRSSYNLYAFFSLSFSQKDVYDPMCILYFQTACCDPPSLLLRFSLWFPRENCNFFSESLFNFFFLHTVRVKLIIIVYILITIIRNPHWVINRVVEGAKRISHCVCTYKYATTKL